MKRRAILVGIGSWGEWWCRGFLPPVIRERKLEIAAAVDLDPQRFKIAEKNLGISYAKFYTDARKAFEENRADFCIIVVQPRYHKKIVDLAIEYGLDILSEKPIADTLESAIRIAEKVRRAGRKMAVTMSHRFDQDKTTLREAVRSGKWGRPDYLIGRFTCNLRQFGSWGEFRHQMKDPLLWEGAVHHLDILADLAGAPCSMLYAQTWKPDWAEYEGNCNALIQMTFENGVRAFYEGAKSNAVTLNGWANEYILVRLVEQNGLEVPCYAAWCRAAPPSTSSNEVFMERFEKALRFCVNCNIPVMRLDSGSDVEELSDEEFRIRFDRLVSNWSSAAQLAASMGIKLVFESEPPMFLNKTSEVISAVEAVNEPNLKLIFDPSHSYLTSVKGARQTGEKEILPGGVIEYIHMMGHHIGYVHMVDTSGKLSELDNAHTSDHLPLGEGILDLDAIIDALWPYAGHLPYWSLDFYACHDAERTGRESLQILREKVQRKM